MDAVNAERVKELYRALIKVSNRTLKYADKRDLMLVLNEKAASLAESAKRNIPEGEKPAPPALEEDAVALDALDDAIGDAYAYRQGRTTQKGYTDACAKSDFEADEKALARLLAPRAK